MLHKGLIHCSTDCKGETKELVTQYRIHLFSLSKSLGHKHNFRGSTESENEHFLPVNDLRGQNSFCGENWEHRRIILSRDPVTPEEYHMLGRMTTMKRLWSSASRKPLATTFPRSGSWQGSETESSRCVLIAKCDYMMECHRQHLFLWAFVAEQVPGSFSFTWTHLGQICFCLQPFEWSVHSVFFFPDDYCRNKLTFKTFDFFFDYVCYL